jgi:hypothetical protein
MKNVVWTDEDGYKRVSLLRDRDPDHMAPEGIPLTPPDLSQLDWEEMKRELHNSLVDKKLFTWDDVQREQNGVSSAILSVMKRRMIALYRRKTEN